MGLLALAGVASGLGQGLGKGLESAQSYLVQSFLQQERDQMENDRLQLQEQFAGAREQRGYAHAEELQKQKIASEEGQLQTRMGYDIVKEGMAAEREKEKETRQIGQAKDLRTQLQREEMDYAKQKAQDPEYLKAFKTLRDASESRLEKAQRQAAEFKVLKQEEDRQIAMNKADAITAAAIFRDTTNEITRLTTELNKAELAGSDTTAIQQQINDAVTMQRMARARAAALSGVELTKPKASSEYKMPDFSGKANAAPAPTANVGVTDEEANAVTREQMQREEATRRPADSSSTRPQGEVMIEPRPGTPPPKPKRGMIDKFGDLLPKRKQHQPKE